MYVGNLQKLKGVKGHIKKYDMVDPFKIPVMIDPKTENTALWWGYETTKRGILVHLLQVDLNEAITYQQDTTQYA